MTTTTRAPRTPPGWLNALMRMLLHIPGLQRWLGRSTALITFTGRRSGVSYTTPVTYTRHNHEAILTAHESRQWWRNLETQPRVALRLAGSSHHGTARILRDDKALPYFVEFLEDQPVAAKASGVKLDEHGRPNIAEAKAGLNDTVVVVVDLDRPLGVG